MSQSKKVWKVDYRVHVRKFKPFWRANSKNTITEYVTLRQESENVGSMTCEYNTLVLNVLIINH